MYDSTITSAQSTLDLEEQLRKLSQNGWIVRAGWFGNNRHYLALQRTKKQEEPSGPKTDKGRSSRSKTPPSDGAGK